MMRMDETFINFNLGDGHIHEVIKYRDSCRLKYDLPCLNIVSDGLTQTRAQN